MGIGEILSDWKDVFFDPENAIPKAAKTASITDALLSNVLTYAVSGLPIGFLILIAGLFSGKGGAIMMLVGLLVGGAFLLALGVIFFLLFTFILHTVSRLFGGNGSYAATAYAWSVSFPVVMAILIAAQLLYFSAVLLMPFGLVLLVVALPLLFFSSIYLQVLGIVTIKEVHGLSYLRSALAYTVALSAVIALLAVVALVFFFSAIIGMLGRVTSRPPVF